MCDELIEHLNAKCVENIANRTTIAPLIETLNMLNGGQGLGVSIIAPRVIDQSVRPG